MVEQKQQYVSAMMDDVIASEAEVEELINDPEMRSIWSRFHLIRDVLQGDLPEAIDHNLDIRIAQAIQNEPALLVPGARKQVATIGTHIKHWTEQATSFAIAASVVAVMIIGAQMMNMPQSVETDNSAITSLELLNVDVDNSLIDTKTEYTGIQEFLLDHTREHSIYGLQYLTPDVSVVNQTVPVILKPTSDKIYYNLDKKPEKKEKQ